jgi:hypothetical protein
MRIEQLLALLNEHRVTLGTSIMLLEQEKIMPNWEWVQRIHADVAPGVF